MLNKLFKKRNKYPERAKYKKNDMVNFRRRDELSFGYVYEAFEDKEGKITYTIQIGGQCPAFLYDWPEEKISGLKNK